MKVVALCLVSIVLVYPSLVTAGFFSPSPEKHKTNDDDVTVNIEKDDGVTKVSVSPHDDDDKGFLASAKDKLKEAEEETHHKFKPGEVICDAYGKCKEYMGRTKEAAEEAVRGVAEKVKGTASEVKEGAKEKAKETQNKGKKGLKGVMGFLLSPVLFAGVLHLLGFATAYGMSMWVTFGSNYVLAKALPRQQFAMVQSKIYPVYFKAMATSVGMALVGHVIGQKRQLSPYGLGIFRGFDLAPPLLMVLVNLFYLEPRASKIMSERMKKEKEEGRGKEGDAAEGEKREEAAAAAKMQSGAPLGRLNSYSSLLNVATLMSLTWHLVHLGHHLHAVC